MHRVRGRTKKIHEKEYSKWVEFETPMFDSTLDTSNFGSYVNKITIEYKDKFAGWIEEYEPLDVEQEKPAEEVTIILDGS